jgi:hypothetical protein
MQPTSSNKQNSAAHANSQEFGRLPTMLYCYGCGRERRINFFSVTQLRKASQVNPYAVSGRNLKQHKPTCTSCTPTVNSELKCIMCHQTKSLEGFAKAQRRHADAARCLECMAKREEEDSDHELNDSDDKPTPTYYDSEDFDDLID